MCIWICIHMYNWLTLTRHRQVQQNTSHTKYDTSFSPDGSCIDHVFFFLEKIAKETVTPLFVFSLSRPGYQPVLIFSIVLHLEYNVYCIYNDSSIFYLEASFQFIITCIYLIACWNLFHFFKHIFLFKEATMGLNYLNPRCSID